MQETPFCEVTTSVQVPVSGLSHTSITWFAVRPTTAGSSPHCVMRASVTFGRSAQTGPLAGCWAPAMLGASNRGAVARAAPNVLSVLRIALFLSSVRRPTAAAGPAIGHDPHLGLHFRVSNNAAAAACARDHSA